MVEGTLRASIRPTSVVREWGAFGLGVLACPDYDGSSFSCEWLFSCSMTFEIAEASLYWPRLQSRLAARVVFGFGFKQFNAPFDATGGGRWIGVAFDMKINVATPVVWVSMPMVGTDVPDPQYNDAFPLKCQYYTMVNSPVVGGSSCFAYHRMGIFSSSSTAGLATQYNTLGVVGQWKRFCVLYSEVAIPNWANAPTISTMPAFDPTEMLKVGWDMYQPYTGGDAASFDVSLDNFELIAGAQAASANNCDPSMTGQPPGSGNAG